MFSISFCLYRACFTHLISSNLSCNLCLWYWFTKIKKSMQTYIVIVSGSILNVSTVHLNGIWHLIWRYLLKPVLGGHPVLSGHYKGVHLIQVSLYIFKMVILYFWHFLAFVSSDFFLAFSPLQKDQKIVIILLRSVLSKNKKTKKI